LKQLSTIFISYRILSTLKVLRLAHPICQKTEQHREKLEKSNYLGVDRQRIFSASVNLKLIFSEVKRKDLLHFAMITTGKGKKLAGEQEHNYLRSNVQEHKVTTVIIASFSS